MDDASLLSTAKWLGYIQYGWFLPSLNKWEGEGEGEEKNISSLLLTNVYIYIYIYIIPLRLPSLSSLSLYSLLVFLDF